MREGLMELHEMPPPDILTGTCCDCRARTRLFVIVPGHFLCLECLRTLVYLVLDTSEEPYDADP